MELQVDHLDDVATFLDRARPFLEAREVEHALMLGICGQIGLVPELFAADPPRFAVVSAPRRGVVAATLRTPPNTQVLSEVDDPAAPDVLAEALAAQALPGVVGPKEVVERFAARWTALTGQRAEIEVAERIFRLDRVVPPKRPAKGSWRFAEPGDRELIARCIVDFAAEAVPGQPPILDPLAAADRWIARLYRTLYLWVDDGRVVSLVGAGGESAHGARIGPVYTPPEHRGRGYATSLTAAASQHQLDNGRTFLTLFTDLANPTSNSIYQAIGYRPVRDVDMVRFRTDA